MAQIQDRKSNFYSQKQSIRDETSAPQYLESAGDILIKKLAKKQTKTTTTLEEQLKVVQNFEKGFELGPDTQKGIKSLEDFKKQVSEGEQSLGDGLVNLEEVRDLDELMRITGLTRHELELSLCEKPNSSISQLYKFAIQNKKQTEKHEPIEMKLPDHPLNKLKEIEKECFGHLRGETSTSEPQIATDVVEERKKTKKKHRKRRKKVREGIEHTTSPKRPKFYPILDTEKEKSSPTTSRPSLWDVKDMKKWKEGKVKGCEPRALYTIKDGKIIKLEKDSGSEDIT